MERGRGRRVVTVRRGRLLEPGDASGVLEANASSEVAEISVESSMLI